MNITDRVVVVTGGGSGIGAALARRFAEEKPRGLIVADLDIASAISVASDIGATAVHVDVADPESNDRLIDETEDRFGPVDLFCANAGIGFAGDEQTTAERWDFMWRVNLMSHVHAARRLIPGWLARREGYFLSTASAAGLLTNLKAAQYSVTKHAAVSFAEWLAITYGDQGIKVSCLCPMGVKTPLLDSADEFHALLDPLAMDPDEVADAVVAGIAAERFLILPHAEVEKFFQNKANDYDRWIGGMRKLQRTVFPE
ncbi:MAG TPA: SDR family oxidoreductase [Acidimicrobiia bacterium]|nr:short-chain dehydrogenase/reductase [Acidimicrobiia bacterium]HYJ25534.1 SDR family oxidoreductase [Acidimicrobiia bacterium]